ncbi:MAG TPA: DUF4143 domain-containing protein [Membranihabitans sp.]|nr:DUF4143 domain-containing protein [Membranihabitans sp.]
MTYFRRIIDDELDELFEGIAAIAIEGAKAIGKTETAIQRAKTIYQLDDPAQQALLRADPNRILIGEKPILIDEWQRMPETWDIIRRAVDKNPSPNQFILTGSATPISAPTHSGAGRIVRVRMRPFSIFERRLESPSVKLSSLLQNEKSPINGETKVRLHDYVEMIVTSGFPGLRDLKGRPLRAQLESYISRIVDRDFEEMGQIVRKPEALKRWLAAYAAATATTASMETIRNAATSGEEEKPNRTTVNLQRDILERLWILDSIPAWIPSRNYFSQLAHPDKHHLVDPALAAILLGVRSESLLEGEDSVIEIPRDGTLLGHLFESLVTQSIRVYAQKTESSVRHLRTKAGRQEIDLIIERADNKVIGVEVKLTKTVTESDVKQLLWLKDKMGHDLLDAVIITTGNYAYRRKDGIAVIPAALLGP